MNNRVIFEIAGIGKRMNGVSKKNNRPYDFTPVSLLYDAPGFLGRAAVTMNLDAALVDAIPSLEVGSVFEAVVYIDAYRRLNIAYIF